MKEKKKVERAYNLFLVIEKIEENFTTVFLYLIGYGFSIGFIIIGITLMLLPPSSTSPKWILILAGLGFLMVGIFILLTVFKISLENYLERMGE